MRDRSQNIHPLIRDGRSQANRRLPALEPDTLPVDDKSLEQILEFVYDYARLINYYDKELNKKDWLAFFRNSVPFQIARITRTNLEELQNEYSKFSITVQKQLDYYSLNPVLDFLIDQVYQVEFWRNNLNNDKSGLKEFLENIIQSNLSSSLRALIKLSNSASAWGYPSKSGFFSSLRNSWQLTFADLVAVDTELSASFVSLYPADTAETNSTPAPPSIFAQKEGLTLAKAKFDVIAETFLKSMEVIRSEAKTRIKASIVNDNTHEPHLGLFFAFLQIFEDARNDFNQMSKRHLDFFYKKVLQLSEKQATLDKAHLVFQISPIVETYPLEKGMLFTAGDDEAGVEMLFELEKDIVVDNAQVEQLKTLFLDQVPASGTNASYDVQGVYAAPQANSADGQGEGFIDENNISWETVGEKVSKSVDLEKTTSRDNPQYKPHPNARLGMIVGTKALFLEEGNRKIIQKFECNKRDFDQLASNFSDFQKAVKTQFAITDKTKNTLEENGFEFIFIEHLVNKWESGRDAFEQNIVSQHSSTLSPGQQELVVKYAERSSVFDVYLTIEEDWLAVPEIDISIEPISTQKFYLVLTIELDENQPPIVAFDPEFHGFNLELDTPAIRLEFNHDFIASGPIGQQGISLYHYFRFIKIQESITEVEVDNVRNLILQNNDGIFSADAPFLPFGAEPQSGENLYIGSPEIFQKDLTRFNLHLNWNVPEDPFWQHYLGYQSFDVSTSTNPITDTISDQNILNNLVIFSTNLTTQITKLGDVITNLGTLRGVLSDQDLIAELDIQIAAGNALKLELETLQVNISTSLVQPIFEGLIGLPEVSSSLQSIIDALEEPDMNLSLKNETEYSPTIILLEQTIQDLSQPQVLDLADSVESLIEVNLEQLIATQVHPGRFKFDIHLLKNRAWQSFTTRSRHQLFDYIFEEEEPGLGVPFANQSFEFALRPSPLPGSNIPTETDELLASTNAGFIRLSLKPEHFRHEDFPDLLSDHLTAQGLWAAEIAQAEANLAKLDPADTTDAAEISRLEGERPNFKPSSRVPDVVYLNIQDMIALLKLSALELKSWMAILEQQFQIQSENYLEKAINMLRQENPDRASIQNLNAALGSAITLAKSQAEDFFNHLNSSNIDPFNFLDPNNGTLIFFPEFVTNALDAIRDTLIGEDSTQTRESLIEKLEKYGADPLHYVNLLISATNHVFEIMDNEAVLRIKNAESIANILPLFYTESSTSGVQSYYTFHIPVPQEPYTPEITTLSVDYSAVAGSNQTKLFHLHPFEGAFQQLNLEDQANHAVLLPQFVDEGTLFLGINNLRPGSKLQLLFQMSESTADPFTEQADVNWSFLVNNTWVPLENGFEVLSDETNGLIKSGILEFSIPKSINTENTILSPELFWLKAAVPERAKAISETIAVHTQAARVIFVDRDNDLERLARPLPKGSISEAVLSFEEIEAVNQFYDSFGGRPKEKNIAFYTRVSERLRHKGRGITLFDFERLILDSFPQIYKVKCITHTLGRMAGAAEDDHLAPGFVTIAVIPNLRNIQFANRFEPRATVALLKDIEKLIRKKISPFVRLRVLNPDYEAVNFSGKIGFVEGIDETFHKDKLRQEVQKFLAPWAFDPTAQVAFGGRIFRSTVLRFIEEQQYVDYVTDFTMFGADKMNVADIAAASARSILVPGKMSFEPIDCCLPSNS